MAYIARGRDRRADIKKAFAPTKSVFCVARPYPAAPAGEVDPQKGVRYARYLRGRDYHMDMTERLERIACVGTSAHINLTWKACVDTSAVLERAWAAIAGLGWIGKNAMLIHPQYGSYILLGELLLSEKLGLGPRLLPDYCGHCTRCLTACPTDAFIGPRNLDSRRCISYWTLEHRGPLELGENDRKALGNWVAGCDICQEVCPFNFKRARTETELPKNTGDATQISSWEALAREDEENYNKRVQESALKRVKPSDFRRNVELVIPQSSSNRDPEEPCPH